MGFAFDTFIFDLDGTILNTMPDLMLYTNMTMQHFDMPEHSYEAVQSFVGNGAKALVYQAVPEGTPERVADAALAYWKGLFDSVGPRDTAPYPGVVETLEALRAQGCKLAVLSNKFDRGTQLTIETYLPGLFHAVHGESEATPRKPDPTGLLYTMRELDSSAETTLYVGDSPGDMLTALRAGTAAAAVSWGYHPPQRLVDEGAHIVLERFDQLLEYAVNADA